MKFSIAVCRPFRVTVDPAQYEGFFASTPYPVLAIEEFYDPETSDEVETYLLVPDSSGQLRWVSIEHCVFETLG